VRNASGNVKNPTFSAGITIHSNDSCPYNTIRNCLVYNNSHDGILIFTQKGKMVSYNIVQNCEIYNNGRAGVEMIAYSMDS